MTAKLMVGDQVTVLPPWDDDPYILTLQHYGTVIAVGDAGCTVSLADVVPHVYGPFAADRLVKGWRDGRGRWWLG